MLEKWCFFFKYADETAEKDPSKIAGDDFILEKAYEVVNQYNNWTEQELYTYEWVIKRTMDNNATRAYFVEEGFKEGIRKDIEENRKTLTKNEMDIWIEGAAERLLKKSVSIRDIIEITNLSEKEIDKISKKIGQASYC